MTAITRIFLGVMVVVGLAAGAALVAKPELREARIAPFFWIVIAMALFELAAFARGQGAPSTTITMEIRILGFLLGVALMAAVPMLAGSPGRLF